MKTLQFCGLDACVRLAHYEAGSTAMLLEAAPTQNNMDQDCYPGERIATVSVMLGETLNADEICVKTWSENSGLLELLIQHGLVTPTGRSSLDPCQAPIVKLNHQVINQYVNPSQN